MKIYEKPMANIEMLEVEDVITASIVGLSDAGTTAVKDALTVAGGEDANVIIFQW